MKQTDRQKNISKAFQVNPKYLNDIQGKNILIVDDVFTSGSTLNECAKTLYDKGVAEVNCLTLAKVVKT